MILRYHRREENGEAARRRNVLVDSKELACCYTYESSGDYFMTFKFKSGAEETVIFKDSAKLISELDKVEKALIDGGNHD